MDYENQKIVGVEIKSEMKKSFIDYAMSVIVARALPDVRDGLKPVHRRILYTMYEDNLTSDKGYRKSATTVGAVLGKYHPHGDMSVYDALVRMAQSFSLRYPLVDGHGNFGSIDGDPPAAYRYTEARMSKISNELLTEIEKNTVDFAPNYDEKLKEPMVLPARFPNLLVNGSSGIAVGMATNIPPHNLREVIDGTVCLIDNPEATVDELMEFIKGPDFPTAGTIMGRTGIRCAYATGKGRVFVRAKADIVEHRENRYAIIISEIPYQVNKTRLIENIAELVKDKRVEGISDMRDESSDRAGMRIVIELKRDANPQLILNQLYQFTQMQDTFSINMLALVNNEPKVLSLRQILGYYIDFQKEIIVRRTRFDLKKAEDRAHILEGLRIALDNIDEVISTIRTSYNNARERLMERFGLSDVQAQAILDMRLARLQGLEREKIDAEYEKLEADIKYYKEILASEELVLSIVKQELLAIRDKYGDDRKTAIEAAMDDFNCEDLIEREDCVITRTHFGYIKRMPVNTYRAQKRGGKGITGMTTREEDFVEELFVASTHSHILFFTDKGRVFRLKGYNIPEASRTAKGTNMVNLLQVEQGEKVTSVIHLDAFDEGLYLTMVTSKGVIKRTDLTEYDTARRGGLKAILLEDDDLLVNVCLTDGKQRLLVGSTNGKAIRFDESDVRPMGRVAHGVRAIKLRKEDTVVGMVVANETGKLLTVTENGYGKRTEVDEYKVQTRGGTGIFNYNLTEKTGKVAGIMMAEDTDDVILISSDGIIIRFDVKEIPVYARVTQGVRVMRLDEGVSVVTLARTEKEEEDILAEAEVTDVTDVIEVTETSESPEPTEQNT